MNLRTRGLRNGLKNRRRPQRQAILFFNHWYLGILVVMLGLGLAFPLGVQAQEVGTFTQVVGQVDLLKPKASQVIPVKVQTGAEEKDEVNTKALSKAELRFIDESLLQVAPQSRITIESYMYDSQKGLRRATEKLSEGLIHCVVTRLFKAKEEDITLKTRTAILGIRGTDFYVLVGPDFTDVFVQDGRVCSHNISPDIPGEVCCGPLQANRIGSNQAPTQPTAISNANLRVLGAMMNVGLPAALPASSDPVHLVTQVQTMLPLTYTEATTTAAGAAPAPAAIGTSTSSLGGGGGGVTPASPPPPASPSK